MPVLEKLERIVRTVDGVILIVGATAGVVTGGFVFWPRGIMAAGGGVILGGLAGLYSGLVVIYLIETVALTVWRVIRK